MTGLTFSLPRGEQPVVAIVGRPNVGKSTLFNRLIGRKKAITDPTPGVTRDPVSGSFEANGRTILLYDTGGVTFEREGLNELVTKRSMEILEAADLVILVMEIGEITSEDQRFIELLRPYAKKIVLAVNKTDHGGLDQQVWEFHSFGFPEVIPISAAHGRGCERLKALIGERMEKARPPETPDAAGSPEGAEGAAKSGAEAAVRISILGKPNTGKSTLLNTLPDSSSSIVSDIPGTTRDVVEGRFSYHGRTFMILDTAGIRRKAKVEENVEYYSVNRAIATIDSTDIVILLIDALEGLSDQDKKIADLAVKKGRGILIVLNKWDLVPRTPNTLEAYRDRISFVFPILGFAPVLPLSALTGDGTKRLLDMILTVYGQLNRRVETGKLNRCLGKLTDRNPPPRTRSFQFKVKYITQVSANPVSFVLFVNRKKGFPKEYVQYLINGIRKEFGFTWVPISIETREQ